MKIPRKSKSGICSLSIPHLAWHYIPPALKNGRRIYLLADGRLVNLASAEGHPASVMDMSFADQALSAEFIAKAGKTLEKRVYKVPAQIDQEVARLKLQAMKISIDRLTPEQKKYLASWEAGT